jgi:hypothetical protein
MVTIQCACCNRVMGIIAPGELDGLITAVTHSLCLSCRFLQLAEKIENKTRHNILIMQYNQDGYHKRTMESDRASYQGVNAAQRPQGAAYPRFASSL